MYIFDGFARAAHNFHMIWSVFLFAQFRFGKGTQKNVEFDWVGDRGKGGGEDRWRSIVREGIDGLKYYCRGFGGCGGRDRGCCVVLFVRIEVVGVTLHIFESWWDEFERGGGVGDCWRKEGWIFGGRVRGCRFRVQVVS